MKKYAILGLILLLTVCEKDRSPVKPPDTGTIKIVLDNGRKAQKSSPDSLSAESKASKSAVVNQLEVRVLKSDNSQVTSKLFFAIGGNFEGNLQVKAQNDLKVLCIGTNNGIVERFGIDEDVDVQANETTTAVINGWNERFIPEITMIDPNPSTAGSYTVHWNLVPNASSFVLQEADNNTFDEARTVFTGFSLEHNITGKSLGTYYCHVNIIILGFSVDFYFY